MDNEEVVEVETTDPPAAGQVQSIKDVLAEREAMANINTPCGMKLMGWMLDGWVSTYPLYDGNAVPVYAFKEAKDEVALEED